MGDGNGIGRESFFSACATARILRNADTLKRAIPAAHYLCVISPAGTTTIESLMDIEPDIPALPFVASLPSRLIAGLHDFCLWFSLALTIWLSSGWIGLLLHWQADLDAVCPWKERRCAETPGRL